MHKDDWTHAFIEWEALCAQRREPCGGMANTVALVQDDGDRRLNSLNGMVTLSAGSRICAGEQVETGTARAIFTRWTGPSHGHPPSTTHDALEWPPCLQEEVHRHRGELPQAQGRRKASRAAQV